MSALRRFVVLGAMSVAAFGTASCASDNRTLPPIGNIQLHIDTDAPLPPPAGDALTDADAPPLFDRVRVEIYKPGEDRPCIGCTHEFDIDRKLVADGRASVSITPPPHTEGFRARVRLYRAAFVISSEPRSDATLDTTVLLPPVDDEGQVDVTTTLHVEDVGKSIGSLASPVPVQGGPPTPIGLWPSAKRTPCNGDPQLGEVCVPGGAFWMGNPQLRFFHQTGDSLVMRIAVVSPFFLDATEVTVEAFRAAGVAGVNDPMRYNVNDGQPGPPLHCTFTDVPGNDETLPVNCISWSKAREYCAAHGGGDLPTEAQHQYAAGGLEGRLYPWGQDDPVCADAVYARSRFTLEPDFVCPGAWVMPAGSGVRDRVTLPGGVVYDLGGNVAEHALDLWNLQSEKCWGTGIKIDPVCDEPSADPNADGQHTVVGGSFVATAGETAAASRKPAFSFGKAKGAGPAGGKHAADVTSVGFRCSRPSGP